jgi:restriction system protein
MTKQISRSRQLAAKLIYAALHTLVERGGQARGADVVEQVGKRVELDDWAKEVYEKSRLHKMESNASLL